MIKFNQELDKLFHIILKVPKSKSRNSIEFNKIKKWDSLNHVKLILSIESKFNIKIDPETSTELMSYNKISNFIKKNLKK
tara:strand:+ start:486 stop:725 length:240 start_codon:yes stop_codon:yes gene_type:complete